MNTICELPNYQHFAIFLIVALVEMWLGRTQRTKSGSILELILNLIISIPKLFFKRGE